MLDKIGLRSAGVAANHPSKDFMYRCIRSLRLRPPVKLHSRVGSGWQPQALHFPCLFSKRKAFSSIGRPLASSLLSRGLFSSMRHRVTHPALSVICRVLRLLFVRAPDSKTYRCMISARALATTAASDIIPRPCGKIRSVLYRSFSTHLRLRLRSPESCQDEALRAFEYSCIQFGWWPAGLAIASFAI